MYDTDQDSPIEDSLTFFEQSLEDALFAPPPEDDEDNTKEEEE